MARTCQYCGGATAHPSHNNCQWCNVIIGEANCNGIYEVVIEAANTIKEQAALETDARRAHIQAAYDVAMSK